MKPAPTALIGHAIPFEIVKPYMNSPAGMQAPGIKNNHKRVSGS